MFLASNKGPKFIIKYFFKKKFRFLILGVVALMPCLQATQTPSSSVTSLTQVAQQCRQKVDTLWKWQRRLPQAQRRDFHIAIGHASKSCDDLRDLLGRFDQANALRQTYEQSLKKAKDLTQASNEIP